MERIETCQRCKKPAVIATEYRAANPNVSIRVCADCSAIMDRQYRNVSDNQRASA